jgi:hypothetical protein
VSVIFEAAAALWAECRDDYELYLEAAEAAAERATNGYTVNDRGRARGVTLRQLMTANRHTLHAYATAELVDHLRDNPRIRFADYERAWFRDRHAHPLA